MGVQPRQPQRGLSSTLQVQRPPNHHQRSISSSQQQYLPTSPARRDASAAFEPSTEPAEIMLGRHVSTPRRQGSKLRLELSNELISTAPLSATESPQTLTPSRMVPLPDPMETDTTSPALSHQDGDNPPMPMPKRRLPQTSQAVPFTRPAAPTPTLAKKDVRPKPYTVEVPAAAPRYVNTNRHETSGRDPFSKGLFSGHADFFPWSGNHHEDEWSTEAIQKGTWDRGSQNEASSARIAIFPSLKQKSGLNALSTIFMGVLNQRRIRGQITAPSTFKPPPRVTLTDTKREIWLKDLANPAISLRRLSRTIPHGIRGRTLLDQCLNKDVPTERAVWLAKCVGANEIRAFKRKGASGAFVLGGELKWIRDWTVFVEQFIESVVSAFGEPDWKPKVTYAIRLATCLYSEQLLDRDHYLEWIISGLENSPQSRIPMWMLIGQIYWNDLLHSRKCGRRLVFALLNHLNTIEHDPDRDILVQLSSQLSTLIISLIKTNPESFVCPPAWQRFCETLRLALPADDAVAEAAYNTIKLRNTRLVVANTTSPPSGRQYLVQLLDSTLQGQCSPGLSARCWASADEKTGVLRTVVEWATSLHRPGLAKVYVAAGLIESWGAHRINATSTILDALGDMAPGDKIRKKLTIRLVGELVRAGHFSVPQYMQWLIGRGGLHGADEIDPVDGPCPSRLLVELPIHCLVEEQKAQRGSLLRRAGHYSVVDEATDISSALQYVDSFLGLSTYLNGPQPCRRPLSLKKLSRRIEDSSWAVQSTIGSHLHDVVTCLLPPRPHFVMTLAMLGSIRTIMETVEDFSMLSRILKTCSTDPDVDILAACVDTINAHLDIFMAIGTAETLFDHFIERLKVMSRDQGIVVRSLLASLASLAARLPQREDLAKQLSRELAQNDRSNAIDACSPISDSMATQAQTAEDEVSEQIDKLLASGNVIDHPTMNRLFRYVIVKLESGWGKLDDSRRVFSSLLSRLRMLDALHFDKLMADWVSHIRTLKERPPLPELFPLLVTFGCLSMSTILHTANASSVNLDATRDIVTSKTATYLQELLQLMVVKLPVTALLDAEETYRFQIYQQCAKFEHGKGLLALIRNSLVEYSALRMASQATMLPLDDVNCQDCLLETMRFLVVADSAIVAEVLNMSTLPPGATSLAHRLVTRLLLPEADSDHHPSFERILSLANELTMPFCQLKLNLDLSMNLPNTPDAQSEAPSRFEAFAKAMDQAIESHNIIWTSMLPCLSDDITQSLNREAHTRFLDLMPSSKSESFASETTDENRIHLAENLLGVIEAIISGQPPSRSASLTNSLVDKLSDMWEIVASRDEDRALAKKEVLERWLPTLLRFITLHSISLEPSNTAAAGPSSSAKPATSTHNHEARARIILVLCGLLLEMETLPQELARSLVQQIFDISILLVDALPDDLRTQCAKSILFLPGTTASTATTSDPRLYYLFSAPRPTPAENLKLAHREKSSMPYTAAARGMGAMYGIGPASNERLSPFVLRRWEILSEPTPNVGENDTSLSLRLFEAIKVQ
ncbi:Mediator complex, subunit Med12 [Metarhizium album ARSEF 1941]|uniref:Mediator of RNA polymerase II transcription subunit 12 n=1 Tax=Metarhizium album (strain ARSEF 1941) TaxID=1081103 RepID=A0A0B2X131_METAS|nr:Mediator complex, subunit Med12 [Metarhizium album ARSEF 1941]KHN98755.1 Mediator complex, subunit Med12 [Metarhizium album ARSEF 1941]